LHIFWRLKINYTTENCDICYIRYGFLPVNEKQYKSKKIIFFMWPELI